MTPVIQPLITACEWSMSSFLVISDNVFSPLLYYSYFGSVIPAIIIALFVFLKGPKKLANRLLLLMVLSFAMWVFGALVTWATEFPPYTMFFWSLLNLFEPFVYFFAFYFVYVFIFEKDFSTSQKIFFSLPLLITLVLTPSIFGLLGYNLSDCERNAVEGIVATYGYIIEILYIFLTLGFAFYFINRTKSSTDRKKAILVAAGIVAFLLSFSSGNILEVFTENWYIGQYGLFGAPIFVGFLAYIMVKYKAFNIKLIGAQALVFALGFLVLAILFIRRIENVRIVVILTLLFVIALGYALIKSVKKENEQNESLKRLNEVITKQKEQLEIANQKIAADKAVVEKANQELVKLDKAKTEFINIASHQLRTPISVIAGVASMMLEGDIDKMPREQKQKFYQSVWQKAKKLKIIVNDILNATSFANRKYAVMDQAAGAVNIPELLGQIIKDFEIEAKERGLDLTLSADKNLPTVRGQKEYLEESFVNLINNAIKYTPSAKMTGEVRGKRADNGLGKVAIRVKKDPADWRKIIIEIKDNGIGIPAEARPKLFQRFSRAQNAVNMYTDGTGLGLFIVKEVIEGHGGKVWFESELNEGTTFFVSLPIDSDKKVDIKKRLAQNAAANPAI